MPNKSHWVVRLLYNNNPFYLVSGLIILYALNSNAPGSVALHGESSLFIQSVQLAGWMSGYAIMMALTAVLVVRVAKVWEDARTIYLVVILAMVGMSVVFDQLCVQDWNSAALLLSGGLMFSIILIEVTLRVSGLKLASVFKIPCYLLFGAFFGLPILLSGQFAWVQALGDFDVVLFPGVASLILLGLLPAIQRGPDVCSDNGSPWVWPYYPWSLFVILLIAIVFRSSALAVSFGPMADESLFLSPLFYLPIAIVVFVLLLEIAFVEGYSEFKSLVFFCSPVLLLFGLGAEVFEFQGAIIKAIQSNIASPTVISAWCLVGLLVYFFQRGVVGARFAASLTLSFLSVPTAYSPVVQNSSINASLALALLGAIPFLIELTYVAVCKKDSEFAWSSAGAFFGFWVVTLFVGLFGLDAAIAMGLTATIGWWMVIGLYFDSDWMKAVRSICGVVLGVGSVALTWTALSDQLNLVVASLFSFGFLVVTMLYWKLSQRQGWKRLSIMNAVVFVLIQLSLIKEPIVYMFSNSNNLTLLGGAVFFLFGALITMVKAGAFKGAGEFWNRKPSSLIPGF